jgi:hypothetical protein
MNIRTLASQAIADADRHAASAPMRSSAELCLADARASEAAGDLETALYRAVRSLRYSVGVFSPIYTLHLGAMRGILCAH